MTLNFWPHFDSDQIDAAMGVLARKVNAWTGKETKNFESEFVEWCGNSQAIAMANGSLALSAAYLAIGIGQGDEPITTPRTFSLQPLVPAWLGAKPILLMSMLILALLLLLHRSANHPSHQGHCCGAFRWLAC